MSIIDSQELAYREEHEIDVLTKRIAELERMLEHDRLEIICYENDVDGRDALIRDMRNDNLREVQLMHRMSGIVPPTSTKYDERMRELGIEVDV